MRDHYKTIAFDNGRMMLLDDSFVADLTTETNQFNAYRQAELQDLQFNSSFLFYQIHEDNLKV